MPPLGAGLEGIWNAFQAGGLIGLGSLAAWLAVQNRKLRGQELRDGGEMKSGDWSRLRAEIARLDERCDHLQKEVDECREREGGWMSRALAAEAERDGYNLGRGEVRQEAQLLDSKGRLGAKDDGK
jgi:hypothetical protein